MNRILVVIVTHNSEKYINWCTEPFEDINCCDVKIVDSGSRDVSYLKKMEGRAEVIYEKNIGFAKANNLALYDLEHYSEVLFLNPDARIEKDDFLKLRAEISSERCSEYSYFTVPLVSYDFENMENRKFYDSLGILCSPLGKWYDIRQGINEKISSSINPDVFCGAFFLVRTKELIKSKNKSGNVGFEDTFYMYKEDIELSLRLKRYGAKPLLIRDIRASHCRGWSSDRSKVPYWAKYYSSRNDLFIAKSYKWRALPYSLLKYLYVVLIERWRK